MELFLFALPDSPVGLTADEAIANQHLMYDDPRTLDYTEVKTLQRMAITHFHHVRYLAHYILPDRLTC